MAYTKVTSKLISIWLYNSKRFLTYFSFSAHTWWYGDISTSYLSQLKGYGDTSNQTSISQLKVDISKYLTIEEHSTDAKFASLEVCIIWYVFHLNLGEFLCAHHLVGSLLERTSKTFAICTEDICTHPILYYYINFTIQR